MKFARILAVVSALTFGMLFGALSNVAAMPDVSASAATLYVPAREEFVFRKNADVQMPMASTTKIMTALLLCENGDFARRYRVTENMVRVEGSSMGLLPGDTVDAEALLYGMMLASGNDAANTAAHILAGSLPAFAEMMNRKAREIGMKNTRFVTPSGLDAEGHYSTAEDLALLAAHAMQNPRFREAAASKTKTVEYGNPPYRRTLSNHNKLLSMYQGAVGVKTGFTKKSGRCLVSAAERDGVLLIAVTLKAPSDWEDHRKLFDYGFSLYRNYELPGGVEGRTLPVVGAAGGDETVTLTAEKASVVAKETEYPLIERRYFLPAFVYAPTDPNRPVGTVQYWYEGKRLAEAKIFVRESISAAEPTWTFYLQKALFWLTRLLTP